MIKLEDLEYEFALAYATYNTLCDANGGHEGSCGIATMRARLDLMCEFALRYFNTELTFTKRV